MSIRTLGAPWPTVGLLVSVSAAVLTAVTTLTPMPSGPANFIGLDKALHFAAFFLIAFPVGVACPRWSLTVMVLSALYGGAIELIQPSVGRSADWFDFFANILGSMAGTWVGMRVNAWVRR